MSYIVDAMNIYRQTYENSLSQWATTAFVPKDADNDGCAQVPCADGCRNGKYQEPDGSWHDHVECKGTGFMWVNLW